MDLSAELQQRVRAALAAGTPLQIIGGGSKSWYGRVARGELLSVSEHRGIVHYAPEELVLTARAGTPLEEIEELLGAHGQMLPFEPPHYGRSATLGGTVACNFSGPRRPYAGAARDYVLGIRVLNGRGELLRFGGEVMKNVAGYDVARLMAGALGTLGIILEVSLKVLPRPDLEISLEHHCDPEDAITLMNQWAGRPLPLSAACYDGNRLCVRLAGVSSAVRAAQARVSGIEMNEGKAWWEKVREHTHAYFAGESPLWRFSVPAAAASFPLSGPIFMDWGGALRWIRGELDPHKVRAMADAVGGHVALYRGGDRAGPVFHPLAPGLAALHRRLKQAFDPAGLFNPGRMYQEW